MVLLLLDFHYNIFYFLYVFNFNLFIIILFLLYIYASKRKSYLNGLTSAVKWLIPMMLVFCMDALCKRYARRMAFLNTHRNVLHDNLEPYVNDIDFNPQNTPTAG